MHRAASSPQLADINQGLGFREVKALVRFNFGVLGGLTGPKSPLWYKIAPKTLFYLFRPLYSAV